MNHVLPKVKSALLAMQRLSWEQGLAAQAFYECEEIDTGNLLCLEVIHRRIHEGLFSIGQNAGLSAEPGTCGAPLLRAYAETEDEAFLNAAEGVCNYYINTAPKNPEGITYCYSLNEPESFWEEPFRVRIDGVYHIVPLLISMGKGDEAVKQISLYREKLYDPERRLYRQSYNEADGMFDGASYKAVASGWAAAAIGYALRELPESATEDKSFLSAHLKELLDSLILYRTWDGLLRTVLDDQESPADCEASSMAACAIFWAVGANALDEEYIKYAEKAMEALSGYADQYGIIKNSSEAGLRSGTVATQAFYIMAAASIGFGGKEKGGC